MSKPLTDKRAAANLLADQLRTAELALSDERESVKALERNRDAARARVLDLEKQVAVIKDIMEHVQ